MTFNETAGIHQDFEFSHDNVVGGRGIGNGADVDTNVHNIEGGGVDVGRRRMFQDVLFGLRIVRRQVGHGRATTMLCQGVLDHVKAGGKFVPVLCRIMKAFVVLPVITVARPQMGRHVIIAHANRSPEFIRQGTDVVGKAKECPKQGALDIDFWNRMVGETRSREERPGVGKIIAREPNAGMIVVILTRILLEEFIHVGILFTLVRIKGDDLIVVKTTRMSLVSDQGRFEVVDDGMLDVFGLPFFQQEYTLVNYAKQKSHENALETVGEASAMLRLVRDATIIL